MEGLKTQGKTHLSKIASACPWGLEAIAVEIEVDLASGLPQFLIVGLPDQAVKESRDRVRAAIRNSGYPFPSGRITVNLAPADLKKEGPAFDLAIAVGILAASGFVDSTRLDLFCFLGELSLEGLLRPVCGSLTVALSLENTPRALIVSAANAREAAMAKKSKVFGFDTLRDVVHFTNGALTTEPMTAGIREISQSTSGGFEEVKGQFLAKRALEIAVAGHHNVLMIGPPGSGKTMLAKRMESLFPPLTDEEWLDIVRLQDLVQTSIATERLSCSRPFRNPHHTISQAGLVGGGTWPRPGEVSLAHRGILFLDELTEFHRNVLEVLRGPMEDRQVTISRAKQAITFPAHFLLVCAMNPCPCGYWGDVKRNCTCHPEIIRRYLSKISGPLLDRIDIHLEMARVALIDLDSRECLESSQDIRKRIEVARAIQTERFGNPLKTNADMGPEEVHQFCELSGPCKQLFLHAIEDLGMSARGYFKIMKLARTMADLDKSTSIRELDIAEAIQYRSLDRMSVGLF